MRDKTFTKSQNALEQIVARHGRPMVICPVGHVPNAGGIDLPTIEVPEVVDCLQVSGEGQAGGRDGDGDQFWCCVECCC